MMKLRPSWVVTVFAAMVTATMFASAGRVQACGGFFCQSVPIAQAGEQIIFHVQGDVVTAVVLIQYTGSAEEFSWVVPVPGIPELSTGSDLVFPALELATRPQFNLTVTGSACEPPPLPGGANGGTADDASGVSENDNASSDVSVLEELAVGPYDVQIVTSESSEAMTTWLVENGYQLTDRGQELIDPYVTEDMNFVALKLRQDQDVGDIQPLIMRYYTSEPMVPIRLTAVAAQPDMGVMVWLVGDARAVPLNYLHVIPNYTLLNWYNGSLAAYASYQSLITLAMDEAGGQGFATDYAGRSVDILGALPVADDYEAELARLSDIEDDAAFVAELYEGFVFPFDTVTAMLQRHLPVDAANEFWYGLPEVLAVGFSAEEIAAARVGLEAELQTAIIDPLAETLAVFEGDPYVTRLYTTLSAEEMTLDPTFSFNTDLDEQSLSREATLDIRCTTAGTRWDVTLGAGTGRDGEVVIQGQGLPPTNVGAPAIQQTAVFRTETLRASGSPEMVTENEFDDVLVVNEDVVGLQTGLCGNGSNICGAGSTAFVLLTWIGLSNIRRRRLR